MLCIFYLSPNALANDPQNEAAQRVSISGKALFSERKILFEKGEIRVEGLKHYYRSIRFDIESIRKDGLVPRLLLSSLPSDLHKVDRPKLRKGLFIQAALPLILEVNEKILSDRLKIKFLSQERSRGSDLYIDEKRWLTSIQEDYGLTDFGKKYDAAFFDAILERVDVLPVSMVLAQSAEESGWGTSRFAHEGNALFGQRVWGSANGMKPRSRPEGEKFLVRSFNNLIESVWAYAFNLNTHPAYTDFRAARRSQRLVGDGVGGLKLIGTLVNYSERGDEYVRNIRNIIRVNQLDQFDGAKLLRSHKGYRPS